MRDLVCDSYRGRWPLSLPFFLFFMFLFCYDEGENVAHVPLVLSFRGMSDRVRSCQIVSDRR